MYLPSAHLFIGLISPPEFFPKTDEIESLSKIVFHDQMKYIADADTY